MDGYYAIYEVTSYGETRIANFRDVNNVRTYLEANSDINKVKTLKIQDKATPYITGSPDYYHEYIPITKENANNYLISTNAHDMFRVRYIKFDD